MDWPFDQTPNAITTKQVIHEGLPILLVAYYEDEQRCVCSTP